MLGKALENTDYLLSSVHAVLVGPQQPADPDKIPQFN